jgi:hypothetical protein
MIVLANGYLRAYQFHALRSKIPDRFSYTITYIYILKPNGQVMHQQV